MNIALIAHDRKKDEMVRFAIAYKHLLKEHRLFATGTTGKRIAEATGLSVHRFMSGPFGRRSADRGQGGGERDGLHHFFAGSSHRTAP